MTFRFKDNAPVIHKFNAKLGQMFSCEVWGNRLNQKVDPVMSLRDPNGKFIQQVDDDPVNGADPMLVFKAEADGEHELWFMTFIGLEGLLVFSEHVNWLRRKNHS